MSRRKHIVGFSWNDLFGGVHTAGKAVLSAFGAGSVATQLEQVEKPYLPGWAGGTSDQQQETTTDQSLPAQASYVKNASDSVSGADYVILQRRGQSQPTPVAKPDNVIIYGGRRFNGNGYHGPIDLGTKFSFGFDAPTSVDVVFHGVKTSYADVQRVLLCGGVEKTNIAGDAPMSKKGILNTILGAIGFEFMDLPPNTTQIRGDVTVGAAAPKVLTLKTNPYAKGAAGLASKPMAYSSPSPHTPFGFQFKTTPKGRTYTSLVLNKDRPHDPKKTVQAARAVAKRAATAAARSASLIDKAKATAAKKQTKTAVVGLFGKPKMPAGLTAIENEVHKLGLAAVSLSKTADKYERVVKNDVSKRKAAAHASQQATHIHGMGGEYFNDIVGDASWDEIMGADDDMAEDICYTVGDDMMPPGMSPMGASPDPNNPGFLTDGSPDPSYAGGSGGGSSAGPPNYGAGTPPSLTGNTIAMSDGSVWPQANVDYSPDPAPAGDDQTFYDCPTDADLPLGAVVYDGSHPMTMDARGWAAVANYSIFFGQVPGVTPKGGPFSGYELHNDGWWLHLTGRQPSKDYNGSENFDHIGDVQGWMGSAGGEAGKNGWGPIIGNPNDWTAGLRFSPSGPNGPRFFWFYDRAPSWAVAALLQAKLNDAMTQYKAAVVAGQTDYVNAQLQDKLNAQQAQQQAQAQAQQDAQIAMQQQAADAQDAIAQQQYGQQSQQAQLQMAQQQAQLEAQSQQQELQANALQLQYFQQHPEQMFVPAADEGGGDQGQGGIETSDVNDPGNINWGEGTTPRDAAANDATTDDLTAEANDLFPG